MKSQNRLSALGAFLPPSHPRSKDPETERCHNSLSALGAFLPKC